MIEFSQSLRKLQDRLKTNIDTLVASGLKIYLTYCWGHVIAFKENYSEEEKTNKIGKTNLL